MPKNIFNMDKIIFLFLSILTFVYLHTPAHANLSTGKPDLIVSVINEQQGLIEVKNIGAIKSQPTQLYVLCTRLWEGDSMPCAAGLNLSNHIKKWNTLSFKIPGLKKHDSFRLSLFSKETLPRKLGYYGFQLTIDPLKKIKESNENNNFTSLKLGLKNTITEPSGILSITFIDNSKLKQVKRTYAISRYGKRDFIAEGRIENLNSSELSLEPGKYTLHIYQDINQFKNIIDESSKNTLEKTLFGLPSEQIFKDIRIHANKITRKKITFPALQTGHLNLTAFLDKKITKVRLSIYSIPKYGLIFTSKFKSLSTPINLSLTQGEYKIILRHDGTLSGSNQVDYPERFFPEQNFSIKIEANQQINQIVHFTHLKKSKLNFKILLNGKAVKASVRVKPPGKSNAYYRKIASQYQFSENTLQLLPGRYDLLITPLKLSFDPPAIDVFHGGSISAPGFSYKKAAEPVKLTDIHLNLGETLNQTLTVNSPLRK